MLVALVKILSVSGIKTHRSMFALPRCGENHLHTSSEGVCGVLPCVPHGILVCAFELTSGMFPKNRLKLATEHEETKTCRRLFNLLTQTPGTIPAKSSCVR